MSAKLEVETGTLEKPDEPKETRKRQAQVDPSIQCLSSRKSCKRKRLKGFDFCHKHILEDKHSPFQQCSFIIKSTEERCLNPAPKVENKKTFCLIHTRDPKLKKAHDEIMRRNMKRKLAHCKAVAEAKKSSADASLVDNQRSPSGGPKRSKENDFDQLPGLDSGGIYALQDNGDTRYDVSWFGENDSDADSVDSEEEDPLRHAGVWTLEEALKICRDKMIRKRSLYLEQYKRLHILLKKRKQCHLLRMASAACHSAEDNEMIGVSATKLSERKALGLYQHLNGTELLLERQGKEKRSLMNSSLKSLSHNRCNFIENVDRCENRVLPLSKFCLHHICSDPDQRLYRRCAFESMDSNSYCRIPVLQVYRSTACELHTVPLPRYQSESLQNAINPARSSKSDSLELSKQTGLECDTFQLMDGNKQGEEQQSMVKKALPPSATLDHDVERDEQQEMVKEKTCSDETEKMSIDTQDPGSENLKQKPMTDSSETSLEAPRTCLGEATDKEDSRNALESKIGPTVPPKNMSEISVDDKNDNHTAVDKKHSLAIVKDEVKDSSLSHEKQPDTCAEKGASTQAEGAKKNE